MRALFILLATVSLFGNTLTCRTQMLMGTFATLCAPYEKEAIIQEAFERLKAVEMALSSYAPQADIYRLNHEHNVSLQADTYEALMKSQRYYKESHGVFNIAVGAITRDLYRFGEAERIPSDTQLQNADINFSALDFNASHARIQKGIAIDLGGMGKGFGIDKAHEIFKQSGIKDGSIALSGDIRCIATCKLEITDPFHPEGIIERHRTRLSNLGISTSGNYRRYVENRAHHHLIDPKTKRPATHFASVTLIGDISSSDLDAYATAVSLMDISEAKRFLKQFRLAYILYTMDRKRIASDNIDTFLSCDTPTPNK